MRFIVDLFRYIIIGLCGLAIISAALLLLVVLDPDTAAPAWLTGLTMVGVAMAFVFLVANLGLVATLLSLHDRHAALVDEIVLANDTLARLADVLAPDCKPEAAR